MAPHRPSPLARCARTVLLATTAAFAVLLVAYTLGPGGSVRHVLNVAVYNNVMLAAGLVCVARGVAQRHERLAWILLGTAVLAWGTGNTVWTFTVASLADPPFPSYADIGFLAVYPPAYAAIVLLTRSRAPALHGSTWLDGAIGGLAVAALGTAVVFQAVLDAVGGSRAAIATNLAYPLADLTLIALVVWALGVTGWRPGRTWGLIAAGLLVFSVSDCVYLFQSAVGSYTYGSPTDLGWVAGGVLLAWAAWQPAERRASVAVEGWPLLVAPVAFGLLGLGVLVYDHFLRVNAVSLALAALAVLAVVVRMALTFLENTRILARTRDEAGTDSLTGLRNHRRLIDDLGSAIDDGRELVLAVFDLNGFKDYNDTFGHPAGDQLLARLGGNLARAVARTGTPYRMGGDEFCVILDATAGDLALTGAERALREHGDGFAITAAFGSVAVPAEARTVAEALRVADQRMYLHKHGGRPSAGAQSSDVLLTALAERFPRLGDHIAGVAELASEAAKTLDLPASDVAQIRLAARLHDIGKVAIPDAILEKPGPLTADEREFVRRHTLIGERILLAAPALSSVAGIVRSSHENFDGSGYPDGLAGDEIPLASRVIFVCDAYDAMTTKRPYGEARTTDEALAELAACSGTQFDPAVVEALGQMLAGQVPALAATG
jgi:diguanylate cyclase (GGDEF)-like protein